jgi:hypothetical protein
MVVQSKRTPGLLFRMGSHAWLLGAAAILAIAPDPVLAQAQKRCDLLLNETPGAAAGDACLDLVSLANGGPAIQTAGNATRIGRTGLKFCKNAFQTKTAAEADVVFIFDNSGSMVAQVAGVAPGTADTSFYYDAGGCTDQSTTGTFVMQTSAVPKQLQMLTANAGCRNYAGDPYMVRAQVVKTAIDYMAATSPTSTAGIMGFSASTQHALAPLQLNVPANVARLKDSAIIDSIPHTYYGPPLVLATQWLHDRALTKTAKQAIVFISDGAPEDRNYTNGLDTDIPIFSIYLAHAPTADTARLKELSDLTHGTFNRVDPKTPAAIQSVMQTIIQSLLLTTLPRSIEVTNASLAPPQISRSISLARNADSSMSVSLDSILALKQGLNDIQVKIALNDTAIRTYAIKVQADGPAAPASTSSLACFDPPTLVMLNPQGKVDTVYGSGTTDYQIRLTRSESDLSSVTVTSVSKDSTRPQPWGDAETTVLNRSGGGSVYQGQQPLNGGSLTPAAGNAILESDPNGSVTLTWTHPRDPREFAVYTLPGKKIPVVDPFIEVVRVRDVTQGAVITGVVADPVILYGGADLVPTGPAGPHIVHSGCLANCTAETVRIGDPDKLPSFIFKTASPFTYDVKIFDNLGNFVNQSGGAVDAAKWQTMPRKGDSVAVVLSVLPVAKDGALIGSGVYILRATINTQASKSKNSSGEETMVPAGTKALLNRFGYVRSRP